MQFDLFHSLARVDNLVPRLDDQQCFAGFLRQVQLAEELGFNTIWLAESHFSSELQKQNSEPVIANFHGEVGLNCDSLQLIQFLMGQTKRLHFGTAIHNIVGGNGGPIASADRVNTLAFLNQLGKTPRELYIGFAAGRFPYINRPFGIVPRCDEEREHWPQYKRYIFLEAMEIFLRLCVGEAYSSQQSTEWKLEGSDKTYKKRWEFEALRLVPSLSSEARQKLHFVLGSHDPLAHQRAFEITDVDLFNLSFTPPEQLESIHRRMNVLHQSRHDRLPWSRLRLPRTVLVFVDTQQSQAEAHAHDCFDTYIEAMRGTVELPPKSELMKRALIGTPDRIKEQLSPESGHGFHHDDRLMLWFEFNQNHHDKIGAQMQLFADHVFPDFRSSW